MFPSYLFILLTLVLTVTSVSISVDGSSSSSNSFQLNPAATTIELNFPKNTLVTPEALAQQQFADRSITKLYGVSITVSSSLLIQAAAAYKAVNSHFEHELLPTLDGTSTKNAFFKEGKYSYMVTTAGPTTSDYQLMPTLQYYPLHANGIVVTYNLPSDVRSGLTLSLSGPTMCRIWRGNITQWDDPAIKATNPSMNFASAAGKGIIVLGQAAGGATNLGLSTFCNKIDPMYAAMGIKATSNPAYPTYLYSGFKQYDTLDLVINAVGDVPWSIALSVWSNAKSINTPIAEFTNREGKSLAISSSLLSLTMFELGSNGFPAGSTAFDLTNPSTPNGWPIMSCSYLYLEKSSSLTTCATKKALLVSQPTLPTST